MLDLHPLHHQITSICHLACQEIKESLSDFVLYFSPPQLPRCLVLTGSILGVDANRDVHFAVCLEDPASGRKMVCMVKTCESMEKNIYKTNQKLLGQLLSSGRWGYFSGWPVLEPLTPFWKIMSLVSKDMESLSPHFIPFLNKYRTAGTQV